MLPDPPNTLIALPVDELGLRVLADLVVTGEWNTYNYTLATSEPLREVVAEGLNWLRSNGLIARTPSQNNPDAIFVTRAGHEALRHGLERVRAIQQIHQSLHPLIESEARPQFLLGKYELAVFAAMKAVEVRVRQLASYGDDEYGVPLMLHAFGSTGPLCDSGTLPGEQDGVRSLFVGAYAVLRNPAGHREVNYDDVAEAAEAVLTASLLMRILDKVEDRLRS